MAAALVTSVAQALDQHAGAEADPSTRRRRTAHQRRPDVGYSAGESYSQACREPSDSGDGHVVGRGHRGGEGTGEFEAHGRSLGPAGAAAPVGRRTRRRAGTVGRCLRAEHGPPRRRPGRDRRRRSCHRDDRRTAAAPAAGCASRIGRGRPGHTARVGRPLLALGLTMVVGRYDNRRSIVVDEANDVDTTYLRAQCSRSRPGRGRWTSCGGTAISPSILPTECRTRARSTPTQRTSRICSASCGHWLAMPCGRPDRNGATALRRDAQRHDRRPHRTRHLAPRPRAQLGLAPAGPR